MKAEVRSQCDLGDVGHTPHIQTVVTVDHTEAGVKLAVAHADNVRGWGVVRAGQTADILETAHSEAPDDALTAANEDMGLANTQTTSTM